MATLAIWFMTKEGFDVGRMRGPSRTIPLKKLLFLRTHRRVIRPPIEWPNMKNGLPGNRNYMEKKNKVIFFSISICLFGPLMFINKY